MVVMETLKYTCKHSNTHAYQVSATCIAWFPSLRNEEDFSSYREKCPRPFFVHDRHGNAEIHMRTKFHLHALHGVQV